MNFKKKIGTFIENSIYESLDLEQSFIQDCKKKISDYGDDKDLSLIINYNKDSPLRGFEKIALLLKEKGIDLDGLVNFKKNMKLNFKSLKNTPAIKNYTKLIDIATIKSFEDLKQNNQVDQLHHEKMDFSEIWNELNEYASDKWDIIKIGFTKVPNTLIFADKYIKYQYALIFMQEMNRDRINKAPRVEAGRETMRIYESLGRAVNDIAIWLRERGIKCQSNHPMGGLVAFAPLAGKAGMGGFGKMGLLITPEFGARQRLAAIYIDKKYFNFTDSSQNDWIEFYCEPCGICVDKCPGDAINEEKIINVDYIEGFGQLKTCIDVLKCYKHFILNFGCSVCIKSCPFSIGNEIYYRIKEKFMNSERYKSHYPSI